jgi:hypothetical protein
MLEFDCSSEGVQAFKKAMMEDQQDVFRGRTASPRAALLDKENRTSQCVYT